MSRNMSLSDQEALMVMDLRCRRIAKGLSFWPEMTETPPRNSGLYIITAEKTPEGTPMEGKVKVGRSQNIGYRVGTYKRPDFLRAVSLPGVEGRDLITLETFWKWRIAAKGVPSEGSTEYYPIEALGLVTLALMEMGEDYRKFTSRATAQTPKDSQRQHPR